MFPPCTTPCFKYTALSICCIALYIALQFSLFFSPSLQCILHYLYLWCILISVMYFVALLCLQGILQQFAAVYLTELLCSVFSSTLLKCILHTLLKCIYSNLLPSKLHCWSLLHCTEPIISLFESQELVCKKKPYLIFSLDLIVQNFTQAFGRTVNKVITWTMSISNIPKNIQLIFFSKFLWIFCFGKILSE